MSSTGTINATRLVTAYGVASGAGFDLYDGFGAQWGYRDENSGFLYLLGHRFYNAQTGQFMTRDPIGYAGGINLYGYCQNDPVNDEDEDGFAPTGPPNYYKPGPDPSGKPGTYKIWKNKDGTETEVFEPDPDAPVSKKGHGDGGRNQGAKGEAEHSKVPKGNRTPSSTGRGKGNGPRRFSMPEDPENRVVRGRTPQTQTSCHAGDGYMGDPFLAK